jgi:hypothetical protein
MNRRGRASARIVNAKNNTSSGIRAEADFLTECIFQSGCTGIRLLRSYAGGARLFRKEIKIFSVMMGADATNVVSVKQGTLSEATAEWVVAGR